MINEKLFNFFVKYFKPARICLVGTNDFIGKAIREAQAPLTRDKKISKWSHAFLMGNRREDGGYYIFESDLDVRLWEFKIRNGAQESRLEKWCKTEVEHAAVLDFHLSEEKARFVLSEALRLVQEQIHYPIGELIGTWFQILINKVWLPNPLDDEHAMYCSSYVRYCYQKAGIDILDENVHLTNTAPEHLWQSPIEHTTFEFQID
jgi:hypothetical protein